MFLLFSRKKPNAKAAARLLVCTWANVLGLSQLSMQLLLLQGVAGGGSVYYSGLRQHKTQNTQNVMPGKKWKKHKPKEKEKKMKQQQRKEIK